MLPPPESVGAALCHQKLSMALPQSPPVASADALYSKRHIPAKTSHTPVTNKKSRIEDIFLFASISSKIGILRANFKSHHGRTNHVGAGVIKQKRVFDGEPTVKPKLLASTSVS